MSERGRVGFVGDDAEFVADGGDFPSLEELGVIRSGIPGSVVILISIWQL